MIRPKKIAPRPHLGTDIEETQGMIRVRANFEVILKPLWPPGGPASEALRLVSGKCMSEMHFLEEIPRPDSG